MSEKFTVIYEDRWMSGSHHHCLTKLKRVEKRKHETVLQMLEREGLVESTVFIFIGHPQLVGESGTPF